MKVDYEPQTQEDLVAQEERSLASGNRKLAVVASLLVAGAMSVILLPAKNRERIANGQMPSFTIEGASVVGSRPAADEDAAPASEAPAPAAAKPGTAAATAARPAPKPRAAAEPQAQEESVAELAVSTAPEPLPLPAAVEPVAAPRNVTLAGRVLDEDGQPIAGATIFVKGSRKGTSTDASGNYSLEVPAGDNTLVYGYGGYEDQEMRARAGQPQNVTLLPKETSRRKRR